MPLRVAASGMKHYHVHGTLKLALADPRWRHPLLDFAAHLLDGAELLRSTEDGFRTSMATLVAPRRCRRQ